MRLPHQIAHVIARGMKRAAPSSPRGLRLVVALAVALLHVALILALIRAFAPEFTTRVARQVFGEVTVTVTTRPPDPSTSAAPTVTSQPQTAKAAGAAAEAGKRAAPQAVVAPSSRIVLATQAAPPIAGQGNAVSAGALDAGAGSGAGGQGIGTGSGQSGTGTGGGGMAVKAVKTAGDINSARDYPAATREQRLGDYVVVALTVGVDGRVKSCRVHRASRDPQSDQITCRLAQERFRFRPATDATGVPVESVYGWQQRWFEPKEKN